ncbi:hypothetical protein ACC659_39050, partial [Rhizobium johnstonii]
PCVNPVIVICRSLVRQQHQQSHADPKGGVKAPLTLKETALAKLKPYERVKDERFRPSDRLLEFLNAL